MKKESSSGTPRFPASAAAAFEDSARAVAILDRNCRIVQFNEKLREVLDCDPNGQSLLEFFPQYAEKIRKLCRTKGPRKLERMYMRRTESGIERIATTEFGQVEIEGQIFGVGVIADVTEFVAEDFAALDEADFGVIRIDKSDPPYVRYINQKGARLVGKSRDDLQGKTIAFEEIFEDATSLRTLQQQRNNRADGKAGSYNLTVGQLNSRAEVPLEVFALPDFDPSSGDFVGATAIFHSRLKVSVLRRMHEIIEDSDSGPHTLARAGLAELRRIVPHDFAVITLYYGEWAKATHLEPYPEPEWESNWFHLSGGLLNYMRNAVDAVGEDGRPLGGLLIDDPSRMLNGIRDANGLPGNPVISRLIKEGYRKVLVLPFRQNEEWRASLSLFRRDDCASFGQSDLRVLREEIGGLNFLQAFHHASANRTEAIGSELRKNIREAGNLDAAGTVLPEGLARADEWQHVAFFRCNYTDQTFDLKHECGRGPHTISLGDGFRQPFGKGHLGLAFERKSSVVLNDIHDDSVEARLFVANDAQTNSCLTVPIMLDGLLSEDRRAERRIAGLLHIQSTSRFGFPEPVVKRIEANVYIVEETLFSLQRDGVIETLQREVPSGMILADDAGTIWGINRTAVQMLGIFPGQSERPSNLKEVFASSDDIRIVSQPLNIKKERCKLKHKSGVEVAVLIDTADLPWQGGGASDKRTGLRLIQLTDLNTLRWQHDVETVKAAVSSVSSELRPYLVSSHGLLKKIRTGLADEIREREAEGQFDSLNDSLKKLSVTADRVMRRLGTDDDSDDAAVSDEAADLCAVLESVLKRAEGRSRESLLRDFSRPAAPLRVALSASELVTLFDTVVSYFLGRKAVNGRIRTRVKRKEGVVEVRFSAYLGEVNLEAADSMTRAWRLGLKFASLNEGKLRETLVRHGGDLRHTVSPSGRTRLSMFVPTDMIEG